MNGYLANFIIYTFAMVGFIALALYVYKKTIYTPLQKNDKKILSVETAMKLSPTKTIYILNVGTERFLIAGDNNSTTMLSKLENLNLNTNDLDIKTTKYSQDLQYTTSNDQR